MGTVLFFTVFRKIRTVPIFLAVLALGALAGVAVNALPLFSHPYLWPAVRLVGYLSLLVYALFMLWRARYNTRS